MGWLGLCGGQKLQPGFCLQDSGSASELKAAESQVTCEVFKAALRACRRDQTRSGAPEQAVDSISLQARRRRGGEDEKNRGGRREGERRRGQLVCLESLKNHSSILYLT